VSRSIESINGLTQTNAERIQMITESSRSLVDMVNTLRKEIEDFNLKNSAASKEAAPSPPRRPILQGTKLPAPGLPPS
jgi:hypothetical protein